MLSPLLMETATKESIVTIKLSSKKRTITCIGWGLRMYVFHVPPTKHGLSLMLLKLNQACNAYSIRLYWPKKYPLHQEKNIK